VDLNADIFWLWLDRLWRHVHAFRVCFAFCANSSITLRRKLEHFPALPTAMRVIFSALFFVGIAHGAPPKAIVFMLADDL
jgi:hypothetical protein